MNNLTRDDGKETKSSVAVNKVYKSNTDMHGGSSNIVFAIAHKEIT